MRHHEAEKSHDRRKIAAPALPARLDSQLNLDHPLVVLADLIDWERFDQAYAPLFCPDQGAPALPTRLMVGLEYLKYTYNLSDEELVARWLENPCWQYFCGEACFRTDLPLHSTSLGKWRLRIGAEKLKLVLEETIHIAKKEKFVTEKDLFRVTVDTTVQPKNITHPTDCKPLSRAILKLGKFVKLFGIKLRQPYSRKAKETARKASGYAAAKQYKRLQRCVKDLKIRLGRVIRDIERKSKGMVLSVNFAQLIETAKKCYCKKRTLRKRFIRFTNPACSASAKAKREFGTNSATRRRRDDE